MASDKGKIVTQTQMLLAAVGMQQPWTKCSYKLFACDAWNAICKHKLICTCKWFLDTSLEVQGGMRVETECKTSASALRVKHSQMSAQILKLQMTFCPVILAGSKRWLPCNLGRDR